MLFKTPMKIEKYLIVSLLFLFAQNVFSQEVDSLYSNPLMWYREANTSGDKGYDVFYILPTCVWDKIDANGDTLHYATPLDSTDRAAMLMSFELAEQIFGGDANFYSPYYRQASLQSWSTDSLVKARFPLSFMDVKHSFDYYINHINNGKPFILAGFSQGAKCVIELLKTLSDEQYRQLIASYVIGYNITDSDTLDYKQIKPATCSSDIGVTICYNSVASVEAIFPSFIPNVACINPLNWSTDSTKASLNDTVTVHVDTYHKVLIVDGFDPEHYYYKSLAFLFKMGNYHLQELYFYKYALSANVKTRFEAYLENNGFSISEEATKIGTKHLIKQPQN